MKLHLPKGLLTAVMALFAVSQTVWAETYDLLESDTNWAFTGRTAPSYDAENDAITASSAQWKQSLATYALTRNSYYVVDQFAATIDVRGTTGVMSLAFTGLNETFALGDFAYDTTKLQYGKTSDTSSYAYHNGTGWDAGSPGGIDPANDLGVAYAAGTYEIVGTVNYTDGSYTLDLSINGTEVVSDYALGSSFDVTRITFAHDAAANNQPTLSTLTLTGTLVEPITVYSTTLAEGSTNASAATWTSDGSSVNYADIAMTDGSIILDFTGADAGSTAVLDAGTNVYAIDISGGSVTLQAAEGGITTSELVVKDNATLKVGSDMTVGSLFSMGSNAAVSVANNSTLDITGTDSQLVIGDSTDEFSALNSKITTEDGSFVKIAFNHSDSAELKLGSNLTLQPNVEAVGALVIHGKGGGNQFIIGEGKTLIAKGSSNGLSGLEAINKAVITINGGTVETTKLTLGHTTNDAGQDYWGKLDMTAGSLKLDNITLRNNYTNVFSVIDGELEFTSATALTRNNNTASTITIKGADADNTVTLKALTAGWTLDGAGLATAPTVGNVTIDASNTQMITLANVALDGDILNNATTEGAGLTLSGAITAVGGTSTTEKVMAENGYGIITTNVVIDNFKGAGNYVFADGTTINNIAIADFTREGNTFTYSTGEQTSTIYHVVNGTVTMESVGRVGTATHTGFDVYSDAILDAAGSNPENITVNLRGGATLANSGADVGNAAGTNAQQIKALSLTGDATVDVDGQLGIVGPGLADTTVDLGGYTLTKTGADNFLLMNSAISAGSIDIQEGTIKMYHQSNSGLRVDDAVKVNIEEGANLNIVGGKGGTIDGDFILNSTGTGTINLHRDVNIGSAGGTSTFAGTISVNSNILYLGNTGDGGSEMEAIDLSAATIALNGGTKVRYFGGTSTIGTLKVNQNGELHVHATNKNAQEQGTLNINKVSVDTGKLLTVSGTWDCNVNVGVLTGNGSINITHSGDNKHYAIKAVDAGFGSITNAANLTLGTASTTVNLGSTLTNTGTVTMLGSLVLSSDAYAYADFTVSGAQYDTTGDAVADAAATDGYLVSGSTSFSVVSGGTINKDGITSVTYNGETVSTNSLSIADNKLTLTTQVPTKDYYVNTTVDYAAESVVASDATTGIILNGGTLNLNTALNSSATKGIVAAKNSTINIAADTTLNNSSVSSYGSTVTIAGGSTAKYSMGVASMNGEGNSANNETKLNVAIDEGWQGTVVFEEGSVIRDHNFDLNDYGVAGSTIQFNGTATGSYLGQGTSSEVTYVADIELKGDGFSIENGFGGRTYTFTGAFKGDGTFNMNKADLQGGLDFIFSGNMSKWTGELKQSAAANDSYSYTFNEKATNIANKVTAAAGTMVVNVNNSEDVTMTGDVTATGGTMNLTKTGASNLKVNNIAANGGNVVLTGTGDNDIEVGNMSIKAGNTVTGAADVTVTDTLAVAAENAFTLTGALALDDGVSIDLTGLNLQENKLIYTLGTADGGVSLQNYSITGLNLAGTMYEGYTATLAAQANPQTRSATETALVLTLSATLDTLTVISVADDAYDAVNKTLTLGTELSGTYSFAEDVNITMEENLWEKALAAVGGYEQVTLKFTDADGNDISLAGVTNMTLMGMPAVGGQVIITGNSAGQWLIPEPTTSTLSLLALAALAVRRRRR